MFSFTYLRGVLHKLLELQATPQVFLGYYIGDLVGSPIRRRLQLSEQFGQLQLHVGVSADA